MIRSLAFFTLLLGLGALSVMTEACSSNDAAPKPECAAGKAYFCKCADLSNGQKTCNPDGNSYAACMMEDGLSECPGGELPPVENDDSGTTITDIVSSEKRECPGKPIVLELGKPSVILGDTSMASSNHKGANACGAADGNEHVYSVTAAVDGKLKAVLQGLNDVTLYVRAGSCAGDDEIRCAEQGGATKAETVSFDVKAGSTYWIFADSRAKESGKYSLTLSLEEGPRCNDGIVQAGEVCDDGNEVDDDGCSRACVPYGDNLAQGPCPGVAVHVWGDPIYFTGTTTNMGRQFQYSGMECGPTYVTGVDRVYAVTAHKTGMMTVATSDADFDHVLYARTESCTTANHVACADTLPRGTNGETFTLSVESGKTYYVIVDGYLSGKGTFKMTLGIQAPP